MRVIRILSVAVAAAAVAVLAGCSSPAQMPSFEPGTWQSSASDLSVTLRADGTGDVVDLPYVENNEDSCYPEGSSPRYTGPVTWYTDQTSPRLVMLRLTNVVEGWRGHVYAGEGSSSLEWARLLVWECEGEGNTPPEILTRVDG